MNYATAKAFRNAITARLQVQARASGRDLARLQRRLAYERFLARLFRVHGDAWVLKGGYALELRLDGRARATKDIDFNAPVRTSSELLDDLQDAAEVDLGDYFRYTVERPSQSDLAGPPEGGARFRIKAYLDGLQPYTTFLIDVGHGDLLLNPLESLPARVDLAFAGIETPSFYTYPLPEHFAEKLHAYTCPRPGEGRTRVKDLVDLSLITEDLGLSPSAGLADLLWSVFERYGSHPLPTPGELQPPPEDWAVPFAAMTRELGHPVTDAQEAHERLVSFLRRSMDDDTST